MHNNTSAPGRWTSSAVLRVRRLTLCQHPVDFPPRWSRLVESTSPAPRPRVPPATPPNLIQFNSLRALCLAPALLAPRLPSSAPLSPRDVTSDDERGGGAGVVHREERAGQPARRKEVGILTISRLTWGCQPLQFAATKDPGECAACSGRFAWASAQRTRVASALTWRVVSAGWRPSSRLR